ncbi:MAG: hypothetical protein JWM64_1929 [Frankiales bacterium]|nr:hypothetical protein [Frankiales bacterium]
MQLAQPVVEAHRRPRQRDDGGSGVAGPGEVAADHDGRREGHEQPTGRSGLGPAELVQVDVELTLDAAGGVVTGAPVPQQDDPARSIHRTGRERTGQGAVAVRLAARSASRSTNGMVGQSFQSRSRA